MNALPDDTDDGLVPRDLLSTLGSRIEAMRTNRGLTQAQAALTAGLSQGQWSKLESGTHDPQLTTLLRIQHALDADVLDALLGDSASRRLLSPPR